MSLGDECRKKALPLKSLPWCNVNARLPRHGKIKHTVDRCFCRAHNIHHSIREQSILSHYHFTAGRSEDAEIYLHFWAAWALFPLVILQPKCKDSHFYSLMGSDCRQGGEDLHTSSRQPHTSFAFHCHFLREHKSEPEAVQEMSYPGENGGCATFQCICSLRCCPQAPQRSFSRAAVCVYVWSVKGTNINLPNIYREKKNKWKNVISHSPNIAGSCCIFKPQTAFTATACSALTFMNVIIPP